MTKIWERSYFIIQASASTTFILYILHFIKIKELKFPDFLFWVIKGQSVLYQQVWNIFYKKFSTFTPVWWELDTDMRYGNHIWDCLQLDNKLSAVISDVSLSLYSPVETKFIWWMKIKIFNNFSLNFFIKNCCCPFRSLYVRHYNY